MKKKYLSLPLLFLGFWKVAYIAGPRQSVLSSDRTTTLITTAIAAALITAGFWFLASRDGEAKKDDAPAS